VRKLQYALLDVFTNRAFGGNQLAVFMDGQNVTSAEMQFIAKELNLSETTFVLPAQDPAHTYHVRIFTPAVELPMAGHPTVGTAFVLARENMIQLTEPQTMITFEEGVGPIPVVLKSEQGVISSIQMQQPLPTFGPIFPERSAIAEMLSLKVTDFDEGLPLQVVSCGVPFLYVPVKSLDAIRSIQFRRDVWERVLRDFAASQIFIFTREVEREGSTVHSRMFAPAMGILEDPATGSASGPLGSYLVHYGLVESTGRAEIISEQGFEMGRPSIVQIAIEHEASDITGVYVGGQCYFIGKGYLELPEL
jgi:trans-2,3-dihydro-3-hydroxyanthranilate isomerase